MTFAYKSKRFPTVGYVSACVPTDIFKQITEEVDQVSANRLTSTKANGVLAGQLESEFALTNSQVYLKPILKNLIDAYEKEFFYLENLTFFNREGANELVVDKCWVNFQKKHEFNPPHFHYGVFSFVIWLKIPYNLNDELSLDNAKNSIIPCNSLFTFNYVDSIGRIKDHRIHVDKSFEGTIILFPAELRHSVFPFYTSDEERISVAGNIFLERQV
jgi:hypothetical protein